MKILVIDDDIGITEVVSLTFELQWPDADVAIANTGERGLELLGLVNPDMVILDVGLPGMDGFEVLKAIRDVSRVAVIMLTVRGKESDIIRALDMGADDYVTKPFSSPILQAKVEAVMRRKLGVEYRFPVPQP